MTPRVALLAALATGCTMGPSDLTLIGDVRVLAAVATPPEAAIGERVSLEVYAVEPEGRPATLHAWQCPEDGPCTAFDAPLDGDRVVFDWPMTSPAPIWLLACRIAPCETLRDADRRDPDAFLRGLPIAGVSAAATAIGLTDLPLEDRRTNPTIAALEIPESVDAGGEGTVRVSAPGSVFAAPLTTLGGFSAPTTDLTSEGDAELVFFAPEDPGEAAVYVIVQDEAGGVAVERGAIRIGE